MVVLDQNVKMRYVFTQRAITDLTCPLSTISLYLSELR